MENDAEERFCSYVASGIHRGTGAYLKAFCDDIGVQRIHEDVAGRRSEALLRRSDIQGRIERIKRRTKGAGKLTREGMLAVFESRFVELVKDPGLTSKDKLNNIKAMKEIARYISDARGWERSEDENTLTLNMTTALPAGFKPKNGENATVSLGLTLQCEKEAEKPRKKKSDDEDDEDGLVEGTAKPKLRGKMRKEVLNG